MFEAEQPVPEKIRPESYSYVRVFCPKEAIKISVGAARPKQD